LNDKISQIKQTVLVRWGEKDSVFDASGSEAYADFLATQSR